VITAFKIKCNFAWANNYCANLRGYCFLSLTGTGTETKSTGSGTGTLKILRTGTGTKTFILINKVSEFLN